MRFVMSAILDGLTLPSGNTLYHTVEFMRYIRTHVPYLKENAVAAEINPGLAYKFEYNFFSLLIELKYPFEDYVILLLVNNFTCPTEMRRTFNQLIIPNPEVISDLKTMYRHQNKRI